MAFFSTRATAGLAALGVALVAFAAHAGTLDTVKQRGALICGVSEGLGGFSDRDAAGAWNGFDVDFCRAVAAAVLDDPQKVQFVPLSTTERFDALTCGQGRRAVAQFDLDLRARGGAGDPVRRNRLSRRPGLPGRAPSDRHVGAGARRRVGLRAGRHDDARQSRRLLQGEFDDLHGGHRRRPERGDREARERRLRRLHHRPVGALYRPPRPEEAVGGDDPARRDLEGAARAGGARRRRRLVQRRQMDALRADRRRGARGRQDRRSTRRCSRRSRRCDGCSASRAISARTSG